MHLGEYIFSNKGKKSTIEEYDYMLSFLKNPVYEDKMINLGMRCFKEPADILLLLEFKFAF